MRKFELFNPIRMIFGAGEFDRLGEVAAAFGKKPLVVVGQWHAKNSGLLDRGLDLLKKAGMEPVVFEGIEPNPRLSTCVEGARTAVKNKCDMVIGIGGGSVMDASKIIAFGFHDPDNIWRRVAHWEENHEKVDKALPIVLAGTMAATGSEGDNGAVVTNDETREKTGVFGEVLFPRVSIIDPELTLSAPTDYTRDGAIDMILHVLEGYFNGEDVASFADRCTEGFFVEAMTALEAVMEDAKDLEARSQLSYLGAIALHGFINRPRGGAFPMHAIQHPLSGHFDISHGRGLALIMPRWLRYVSRTDPEKIIQFGDRVFGMELETYHPFEAADRVIDRLDEWLEEVGEWFYMDDLGIPNDPAKFREMAESAVRMYGDKEGLVGGIKPLGVDDIVAIYFNCVRPGVPETVVANEEPVTVESEGQSEGTGDSEVTEVEGASIAEEAADSRVLVEDRVEKEQEETAPEG